MDRADQEQAHAKAAQDMTPKHFVCYRCKSWPCECKDGICLIHGDCRDVLPQLEPGSVDLVLTDPPYGIAQDKYRQSLPETKGRVLVESISGDDSEELAAWLFKWIGNIPAVIWGANNWPHLLPHKGRWCCWDKRCNVRADRMLGSAFELAWENRHSGFDVMIRVQHGGVVNADHKRFGRSHPTQKPVELFAAILRRYVKVVSILDPFAGSGTAGRACKDLGRKCIMIEIEEKYCKITAQRLNEPSFNIVVQPVQKKTKPQGFFKEPKT